tara:strand:+ start:24 stop:533 length:510 start_codon:yes stop_codon:yes gene_type:complete
MPEAMQPSLNRPIPGQHLTSELGGRPWQSPPQYATIEEAMGWYLERFDSQEVVDELMSVIESGIPVSTIANSMQLGAVLQGVHSIDVGVLVMPIIMEMMIHLAKETDTEYKIGDEPEKTDRPSDAVMQSALTELKKQQDDNETEPMMGEEQEEQEESAPEPSGLMARRT